MTDSRLGDRLWTIMARLPHGAGVVLRHHWSDQNFAKRVAARCQASGLLLAVAEDIDLATKIGARMVHNPAGYAGKLLVSRSVHDEEEAQAARHADLIFVSPLFATTSHPGADGIGLDLGLKLAAIAGVPAIALGGIDSERGKQAVAAGFHGWGGIDCWNDSDPNGIR